MKKEVVLASLRLFNAVPVETKEDTKVTKKVMKRTIAHGYILQPEIKADDAMLDTIEKVIGISGEKANAAFHKSWSVVRDASDEQLVIQQIMHYITTYGFEALGIYDEALVYIPNEKLELPKVKKGKIPLTVVKAMTADELLDMIVNLGSTGIALHEDTLKDLMVIVEHYKFAPTILVGIKNRELKARMMDFYGLMPTDPVEFLRYVISKLTDESLLIKNQYLITKIKESSGKHLDDMMKQAPENLASIFLRYKPLFLAMRSISKHKIVFNKY